MYSGSIWLNNIMNTTTTNTITPGAAAELLKGGQCQFIDVRTQVEYAAAHVPGSVNIPLDQLNAGTGVSESGQRSVLILCQSGKRACKAAELLASQTERESLIIQGGLNRWLTDGLPVERDAKVMSLERQVRIAAGALVLLGALLGFSVNEGWFGLVAFVGAGLVFAGITDTCGMGLLLARMPWNRRSEARQGEACCAR